MFKKQTKEQAKVIKGLNISDKTNELKRIKSVFPQNLLNDFISD